MKITLQRIAYFVAIICVISCLGTSAQAEFRVGVILPLSGQYAALGESARKALQLSLCTDPRVKCILEDSQFSGSAALSAFKKLSEIDKVDVLINLDSVSFAAIYPLIVQKKLLTFQLAESIKHENDSVFQIMPYSFPLYTELGNLSVSKFKKIALVYGNGEFLERDAEFFRKAIPAGDLVFDQMLPPGTDYRAVATRLLSTQPEAIAFFVNLEEGLRLLKLLKDFKAVPKVKLICDANVEMQIGEYIPAVGPQMFEGCFSTALPNRMSESFKEQFENRFHEKPLFFADYAFDAGMIVKALIGLPKEKRLSFVQNISIDGASGNLRFDDLGTRLADFEVRQFKDGRFEAVRK